MTITAANNTASQNNTLHTHHIQALSNSISDSYSDTQMCKVPRRWNSSQFAPFANEGLMSPLQQTLIGKLAVSCNVKELRTFACTACSDDYSKTNNASSMNNSSSKARHML